MLLVTWNVNSLKARLPRVLELLEHHAPDVVLLQETKTSAEAFPHEELRAAGYHAADHSAGRWNGVALLAREPWEDVALGLPGEAAPEEARWIEGSTGGTRFASAYVPNGRALDSPEFPRKLDFLEAMARRAGEVDVVAGDLNVCRTDLDCYDPAAFAGSTHVSEPERNRLEAVIEAGLADSFRELEPEEPGYTWWDYRAGHFHKRLGLRIDYVLLAPKQLATLESCGIDRDFRKGPKPSDHAPLLARF